MRPYTPGGELNALASAPRGSIPPTPSSHRLRHGLPGYLIPFAPHAFAPQRQNRTRKPPSPPVFLLISTHFTDTPGIPLSSHGLKFSSFEGRPVVEPLDFTPDLENRLRALTPSDSEQRLLPPCYRGCWHGVSRSFLWRYRQAERVLANPVFVPPDRVLRSEDLPHPRGVAPSGFPPLRKPLDCCLP